MTLKTTLAKEIVVRMPNKIGALDRMAKAISDKGIDILAVSAWVEGTEAVIRLVTDDNLRAMDMLRSHKYEAREAEVVVAEALRKPGMLHSICAKLAQGGIEIHHLYATAMTTQDHSLVVFASANNDRAMVLLNSAGAIPFPVDSLIDTDA
jgi:hypothetical protein